MKLLLVSFVSVTLAAGLFYAFMRLNPWVKFVEVSEMQMFAAMYNARVQQLIGCMEASSSKSGYL